MIVLSSNLCSQNLKLYFVGSIFLACSCFALSYLPNYAYFHTICYLCDFLPRICLFYSNQVLHWLLIICVVTISNIWFALSIVHTQRISLNSSLCLFSHRSVNLFLSFFSNSSVPFSCPKENTISILLLLLFHQFHCLLPQGLFPSNLLITELLVLLLSFCPNITSSSISFLNPRSFYTTRTAYQKSARIKPSSYLLWLSTIMVMTF